MIVYEENISHGLAKEILGYEPADKWERWKLIMDPYEVAVLGYNADGKSESYAVPSQQLPGAVKPYDDKSEFLRAGGTLKQYKSLYRQGVFTSIVILLLTCAVVAATIVFALR